MRDNQDVFERLLHVEERLAAIQITLGTLVALLCMAVYILAVSFFGFPGATAVLLILGVVLWVRLQAYRKSSEHFTEVVEEIRRQDAQTD